MSPNPYRRAPEIESLRPTWWERMQLARVRRPTAILFACLIWAGAGINAVVVESQRDEMREALDRANDVIRRQAAALERLSACP